MEKLRAAVIGVGYFGRFHAHKFAALEATDLVAVADVDAQRARQVAAETGARAVRDYRAILEEVDIVSIAVPTELHFRIARDCLNAGVHILVEKPVTRTVDEGRELIRLAEERGLIFQVGHLERYHPALLAMREALTAPTLIESYRMAPFKSRGTDVSVVLDLMTHDLDILLSLIPSKVSSVSAAGRSLLSQETDFATARLAFEDGCVARLTASRTSPESMRRLHVYQPDSYLSVDYSIHKLLVCRKRNGEKLPFEIEFAEHSFDQSDNLLSEISAFVDSVMHNRPPVVSGYEALHALETALAVTESIENPRRSDADAAEDSDHRPEEAVHFF